MHSVTISVDCDGDRQSDYGCEARFEVIVTDVPITDALDQQVLHQASSRGWQVIDSASFPGRRDYFCPLHKPGGRLHGT